MQYVVYLLCLAKVLFWSKLLPPKHQQISFDIMKVLINCENFYFNPSLELIFLSIFIWIFCVLRGMVVNVVYLFHALSLALVMLRVLSYLCYHGTSFYVHCIYFNLFIFEFTSSSICVYS